ncbi:MAG: hypothetical protein IKE63_01785 [Bacilli bacterium]|nr:hypothetical protein [Bacilli bacterium]
MDKDNFYYYVLHNELKNLFMSTTQRLNNIMNGNINTSTEEYKSIKTSLLKQDQISQILFSVCHGKYNKHYTLSSDIKKLLDELCKCAKESDISRIESSINADIMKYNYYEVLAKLREEESILLQLVYDISLSNKQLEVEDGPLAVEDIIKRMIDEEINSLDMEEGTIELNYQNILLNDNYRFTMNLIKNGSLNDEDHLNNRLIEKEKAAKVNEVCQELQKEINKEQETQNIELKRISETISMIMSENENNLSNVENYLSDLVFGEETEVLPIEPTIQIDVEDKQEEFKEIREEIIKEYQDIVEELEILRNRIPDASEELDKLENRLKGINIDDLEKESVNNINTELNMSI